MGKKSKEIRSTIDSELYAKRFFYMIEGAVYMSHIMKDDSYLMDLAQTMKLMIQQELTQ